MSKNRLVGTGVGMALAIAVVVGIAVNSASSSSPPSKSQIEQSEIAARDAARRGPKSGPDAAPLITAAPNAEQTYPANGILSTAQSSTPGLSQVNVWYGQVANREVSVAAGSASTQSTIVGQASMPSSQGEIVVTTYDNSGNGAAAPYFNARLPGPWTISGYVGTTLTLSTPTGGTFTFSVGPNTFG